MLEFADRSVLDPNRFSAHVCAKGTHPAQMYTANGLHATESKRFKQITSPHDHVKSTPVLTDGAFLRSLSWPVFYCEQMAMGKKDRNWCEAGLSRLAFVHGEDVSSTYGHKALLDTASISV